MAAAAVLKNQKIIMSQQPLDRLPRNMAGRRILILLTLSTLNFGRPLWPMQPVCGLPAPLQLTLNPKFSNQ